MRVIVADTAPLNYLVVIEAVGILPRLFASVLIPPSVKKELSHGHAPVAVSTWIASPPAWLKVVNLKISVDTALSNLDVGEAEAITLALEQPGTLLLMDDRHCSFAGSVHPSLTDVSVLFARSAYTSRHSHAYRWATGKARMTGERLET